MRQRFAAFTFVPAVCLILGLVLAVAIQFGADEGIVTSFAFFAFFAAVGLPFFLADVRVTATSVSSGIGPLSLRTKFADLDRAEVGVIGYQRLVPVYGVLLQRRNGRARRLRLSMNVSYETQLAWVAAIQSAIEAERASRPTSASGVSPGGPAGVGGPRG